MKAKSIHLVGIGGIGLSAIARLLLARGLRVSGSDAVQSATTGSLQRAGALIFQGHRAENITSVVDMVVITSAVNAENPEVKAAQALGIPVVKRRDFLGELTSGYRTIAVAGSHGKTTTTALIGLMLADAGLDPVVLVGGIVPEFGSNARAGNGEYFVIEADEYDWAFLGLRPHIAVITNVDYDHPDLFSTREEYRQAFSDFAHRLGQAGTLIVCGDDEGARAAAAGVASRRATYGLEQLNDWRAADIRSNESGGSDFRLFKYGQMIADLSTRIPGRHNVADALGALAASETAGVPTESARVTLQHFGGVGRRFQVRGEWNGVILVDDYAHHPSEIRATLAAARDRFGRRGLWVVFQPHTFSRTRALLDDFARAFEDADHVIVTEIYASREKDDLGMSGADVVAKMKHRDAHFIATLDGALDYISGKVLPGDVLIAMGAGDVNRLFFGMTGIRDGDRPAS